MRSVRRINLQNNKITNSLSKKSIYMEKLKKKGVKIHLVMWNILSNYRNF